MTGGLFKRMRAPAAACFAVVLLVASVDAGLRFPGTGGLRRLREPTSLDYSAPPVGGFTALRADFVRSVLGGTDDRSEASANASRPLASVDATIDLGPEIVEHALTNDDLEDAYAISRIPFSARSNSESATHDGPDSCAAVGKTVWYRYRPSVSGSMVARSEGGSPLTLGVFTSESVARGSPLACDTDAGGQARVFFTAIEGTDYLFQLTDQLGGLFVFSLDDAARTAAASVGTDGSPASAYYHFGAPKISGNGRYVVFVSASPDLDPRCARRADGTLPCRWQVYVRDLVAGSTELVSLTSKDGVPNLPGESPDISADGRYIVWQSQATNVTRAPDLPEGPGGSVEFDVFLRDRTRSRTERITLARDGSELNGGGPTISAGGRYVAWNGDWENRPNVYANRAFTSDVYWKDRRTGEVMRASESNDDIPGDHDSIGATVSPDGRYVIFMSRAGNLAPGVGPVDVALNRVGVHHFHLYTYDTRTDRIELECVAQNGDPANDQCWGMDISRGGEYTVFWSAATNLVDGVPSLPGASQFVHLYRRHRSTGALEVVTVTNDGTPVAEQWDRAVEPLVAASRVVNPYISEDGSIVGFESDLALVAGDENDITDTYVRDMRAGRTVLLSETPTGGESNGISLWPALSADGTVAAYLSSSSTLVDDDTNGTWDVFVRAWGRHD